MVRSISDEDEGLCYNWEPAVMPLPEPSGTVGIAGPYMPLQGSLLPDADPESLPEQFSLARDVRHPVPLSMAFC